MNSILSQNLHDFVVVCLDGVLVYNKTEHGHFDHLEIVLERLRGDKPYGKRPKC